MIQPFKMHATGYIKPAGRYVHVSRVGCWISLTGAFVVIDRKSEWCLSIRCGDGSAAPRTMGDRDRLETMKELIIGVGNDRF